MDCSSYHRFVFIHQERTCFSVDVSESAGHHQFCMQSISWRKKKRTGEWKLSKYGDRKKEKKEKISLRCAPYWRIRNLRKVLERPEDKHVTHYGIGKDPNAQFRTILLCNFCFLNRGSLKILDILNNLHITSREVSQLQSSCAWKRAYQC